MNHLRYLRNYFTAERAYYARQVEVPGRPFLFSIETTSVCNLKCVMCPYKDMTRPHEMMDVDLFRKIIDEVYPYQGFIWLHNLGEPLAHPRFAELIRYVKSKGLPCGISTNATLLDERRSEELLASGLDKIILCMDGVTVETFEHLRAGASFEKVTDNIEGFLRRKRRTGKARPQSIVQLIFMKETEDQVEEFRRRWTLLADRVYVKPFSTWAEQVDRITDLSESRHRYDPQHSTSEVRHPCGYLWRNLVVTANGDVIPCCVDYDARMVMGNVGEHTLEEIWHGERFRAVRADHLAGRYLETCETCREWVGGPPSRTFPFNRDTVVRLGRLGRRL